MAYPDSVEYLYSLGNEIKTAKFGLEGIRILLRALGDPQNSFRSVHVAGTNGKGSTCAMIEAGLRAGGYRTALYTSPHLSEPTERIRIDGFPVSKQAFAQAFDRVHKVAEDLIQAGQLETHTSYFETVTAMGFLLFRDAGVEFAVIETGLGGRLDATNVVTPELSVITPIDYDHEAYLGNSIESIAREKAGIIKPGVPVVISDQHREAEWVLRAKATETKSTVASVSAIALDEVKLTESGCEFEACGIAIHCPLAGLHQVRNALTAVMALKQLGVNDGAISHGLRNVTWPGRLEFIAQQPDIVLDGAHNPAGARALAEYISQFHMDREVWIVYGAMRDKSVEEITDILFPLATRVILTQPHSDRAVRAAALAAEVDHPYVTVVENPRQAVELARTAPSDGVVFITGSLYLVGEVRPLFVQ